MTIPRNCSGELYKYLEVEKNASSSDIKKSYYKLALKLHPDKTGGQTTEEFKRIVEANGILSDPEQRKLYDTIGRSGMAKLNSYGMNSTMASVISHPSAIRSLIFMLWFLAVLLLILLVLVNVNIDSEKGWTWAVVFIPVWIIFVPLVIITVPFLISGVRLLSHYVILCCLQILLWVAGVCCLVCSLDGHLSWKVTSEVICGAYIITIIKTIFNIRLSSFKEYLTSLRYPDTDNITYSSPIYIKHVVSSILRTALVLTFIVLLSMRLVLDGYKTMNFYAIFSPLFLFCLLPIIIMIVEYFICSLSIEKSVKSRIFSFINLLALRLILMYVFVMVAVKCQRELNDGKKGPSASVCTIPLYISFSSMVLALCCGCSFFTFSSEAHTAFASALYEEENTPNEYSACERRV